MLEFNPSNRLRLVADSPAKLRAIDLDRLEVACGNDWPAMMRWLLTQNITYNIRLRLINYTPFK